MSIAAPVNTYDDPTGARRPSLNDMGGATLKDDAKNPPDPATMPTAASLNQVQAQCASLAKVAANLIVDITNSGSPSISRFTAPGNTFDATAFTVSRLSGGIVQITWTAGTLPVAAANAGAFMTSDAAWCAPVVIPIANGVQVKTRNASGTLVDGSFTLVIY